MYMYMCRQMCLKYAELETKLGELERARTVFSHGSQMSDPRVTKSYWKAWQEFEVRHGNEDTFREMLRIKRSVQAQFNTHVRAQLKIVFLNLRYFYKMECLWHSFAHMYEE